MDGFGNFYIGEWGNNRIRKVNASGIITTVAGNGSAGYSGDGGLATGAQLFEPEGVAVDALGNIYIADSYNERIRKVDANGVISTLAGNGGAGFAGDGGAAANSDLLSPDGVAVDSSGNVFISDTENERIRKVTFSAGPAVATPVFTPAQGVYPTAQTVTIADATGGAVLYYTTNGTIPTTYSSKYTGPITVRRRRPSKP